MSERTEFDDLARRKLEERETAFHEADWLEAQRLIEVQQRVGAWRMWLFIAAGAVILGTTAWWMMEEQGAAPLQVAQGTALNSPSAGEMHGSVNETPSSPIEPTTAAQPQENGPARSSEVNAQRAVTSSVAPSPNSVPAASSTPPRPKATSTPSRATTSTSVRAAQSGTPRNIAASATASSTTGQAANITERAIETNNGPAPATVAASEPPSTSGDKDEAEVMTTPEVGGTAVTNEPSVTEPEEPASVPQSSSEISSPEVETGTAQVAEDPEPGSAAPDMTGENVVATEPQIALTDSPENTDSARVDDELPTVATDPQPATPQDSASEAMIPPPPPPPPPLIKPDSPWEIGALFGGLLSTSSFSGGNSAEWNTGVRGQWTPTFGAELLHMGRNFGVGSGIHYSTYQELLSVEERSLSTTTISDSNYFEPYHTTVLYVLGNVEINGQTYYVTESRDTTINILILGTSTSTYTQKLNDALHAVNRVSYLEIPLLMDAHLVQGSWALGLRGGPTLGVLSGRSGMIPNSAFDGYTPYSDQQFRTTVFGVTARAYIRYRFTNGWSIGLEPTWRGQFGNALSGDLVRRNSAIGGMLSVSYRLR